MSSWHIIGHTSFTGSRFCTLVKEKAQAMSVSSLRDLRLPEDPPDYIVNFAALNVVAPSWDHAADYFRVNVEMQVPIFEYLRQHREVKYVHISTPEVYGNAKGILKANTPYWPSTPYALSRATAETLLYQYAVRYDLNFVVTRGCNVYGPRQQLYRLVPKALWHLKADLPFPLEGAGESKRSFLHVEDMCDAIYRGAVRGWGVFNIAGDPPIFIKKLLEEIGCAVKSVPGRIGQDECYDLDAEPLKALGWRQKWSLQDGLQDTLKWIEANWGMLKNAKLTYEFQP